MGKTKNAREPYSCKEETKQRPETAHKHGKSRGGILGWLVDLFERMGIMSKDSNCRFPWLVPWPVGTKRKCCPKKNELPIMNPLETKCVYKPLVKAGQIWIYLIRGTTLPKWAHVEPCIGKPCKNKK